MGRLGFFGLLIVVLGCTPKTSHSPSFDAGAVEPFREQTAALREGSSHRLMLDVEANSTVLREFQAMDSSVRNGIREVLFEEGLQSENDLGLWIENTSLIHLRVRKTALAMSDLHFCCRISINYGFSMFLMFDGRKQHGSDCLSFRS